MCLHRLLQRGYAQLYGYKIPSLSLAGSTRLEDPSDADALALSEYASAVLVAENMADLNYKMKGARTMAWLECKEFCFKIAKSLPVLVVPCAISNCFDITKLISEFTHTTLLLLQLEQYLVLL